MCTHALLSVLKAHEQDISYLVQITTPASGSLTAFKKSLLNGKNRARKPLKMLQKQSFRGTMNTRQLWQRMQKCLRVGLECTDMRTVNN